MFRCWLTEAGHIIGGEGFFFALFFRFLRPETTPEVEKPSNWNQQTNTTIQQHGVCQPTAAQALSDRELDTVLWKVDMFCLTPSVYLIC
jgi:hypothetical protein